jgi:hypothetical protein
VERRSSPRIPLELPVVQVLADQALGKARTLDVSEDGLRLEPLAGEHLVPGRFAWFSVELPSEESGAVPGPRIRALAELCEAPDDSLRYRIKYIYPADRRRFEAAVRRAAGTC